MKKNMVKRYTALWLCIVMALSAVMIMPINAGVEEPVGMAGEDDVYVLRFNEPVATSVVTPGAISVTFNYPRGRDIRAFTGVGIDAGTLITASITLPPGTGLTYNAPVRAVWLRDGQPARLIPEVTTSLTALGINPYDYLPDALTATWNAVHTWFSDSLESDSGAYTVRIYIAGMHITTSEPIQITIAPFDGDGLLGTVVGYTINYRLMRGYIGDVPEFMPITINYITLPPNTGLRASDSVMFDWQHEGPFFNRHFATLGYLGINPEDPAQLTGTNIDEWMFRATPGWPLCNNCAGNSTLVIIITGETVWQSEPIEVQVQPSPNEPNWEGVEVTFDFDFNVLNFSYGDAIGQTLRPIRNAFINLGSTNTNLRESSFITHRWVRVIDDFSWASFGGNLRNHGINPEVASSYTGSIWIEPIFSPTRPIANAYTVGDWVLIINIAGRLFTSPPVTINVDGLPAPTPTPTPTPSPTPSPSPTPTPTPPGNQQPPAQQPETTPTPDADAPAPPATTPVPTPTPEPTPDPTPTPEQDPTPIVSVPAPVPQAVNNILVTEQIYEINQGEATNVTLQLDEGVNEIRLFGRTMDLLIESETDLHIERYDGLVAVIPFSLIEEIRGIGQGVLGGHSGNFTIHLDWTPATAVDEHLGAVNFRVTTNGMQMARIFDALLDEADDPEVIEVIQYAMENLTDEQIALMAAVIGNPSMERLRTEIYEQNILTFLEVLTYEQLTALAQALRGEDILSFSKPTTLSVTVDILPEGANPHRLTAVNEVGNRIGGHLDPATGVFHFNTYNTGLFTIEYAEDLRRIMLSTASPFITDVAQGHIVVMDVLPVVTEGRTLIPLRFVAEMLGAEVLHSRTPGEPMTISIMNDGKTLSFRIGEILTGMDVPAQITEGRTMVPLRFIAEHFGALVNWNSVTREIEIVK